MNDTAADDRPPPRASATGESDPGESAPRESAPRAYAPAREPLPETAAQGDAAAVVLASGSGVRLGGDVPKQFLPLGGRPVFLHSLETFDRHPRIGRLVLVCHPDWIETARSACRDRLTKPLDVVAGGATRMESSENGLRALSADATRWVLLHDAARPFVRPETIAALLEAAARHGAAVPALAPPDTIVEIDEAGRIRATPDRERLRRVQTPQAFAHALIVEAFARARRDGFATATDDARLVHRLGHPVVCVEGREDNFKITTRADLAHAERLLAERPLAEEC